MTGWIGADTAQLRSLGDTFEEQAGLLDRAGTVLGTKMNQVSWQGTDLESFHTEWTGQHRLSISAAAALLREHRATMNRNADDQDQVSTDDGTSGAGTGSQPPGTPSRPLHLADLQDDLRFTLFTCSPLQQQDWWDGLTDQQRQELMESDPALLATLADGVLTDEEAAQVTETLLDRAEAGTTVSKVVNELSVDGRVGWFTFGAAGDVSVAEKADGTVVVTLTGEIAVGAEFGDKAAASGSVTLTGGLSTAYEFSSQAEADAFLESLVYALVPEWEGEELGNLAAGQYVTGEYQQVLDEYSGNFKETTGSVSIDGAAVIKAGENSVTLSGGFEAEHNFTDGSNKYTLSVDAAAKVGDVGGSGGLSVAVGADADGTLTSLTLSAEASVSANGKLSLPFGDPELSVLPPGPGNPQAHNLTSSASSAATGSATMVVDLSNPATQQLATQYLEAVAAMDHARIQEIQGQLLHDSQVTVQVGQRSELEGGVDLDLKAVEIKVGGTVETNNSWIKVPGTDEYVHIGPGSDRT